MWTPDEDYHQEYTIPLLGEKVKTSALSNKVKEKSYNVMKTVLNSDVSQFHPLDVLPLAGTAGAPAGQLLHTEVQR